MLIVDRTSWHAGADVVVVGYGGAGAVAAVTAHDTGAEVLVLEKQPAESHVSNTSMSGGNFISPSDVKGVEEYQRTLCRASKEMYWTDMESIRVWAEYTCQNRQWVQQMGGKVRPWPGVGGSHREVPGNELIQYCYFENDGPGFMAFLKGLVSQRGIQVLHGVQANRLIRNQHGEVIGVAARGPDGKYMNIRAARAVILATGGFEFDEQMKLQFLRCYPFYFDGAPANTGDGVRMAMGVGADLWHMNCASAGFTMKFQEMPFAFAPSVRRGRLETSEGRDPEPGRSTATCGYVIVDKGGRRFTNENFKQHHVNYELGLYESRGLRYPRIPAYWIMDQRRMADGPLPNTRHGSAGPGGFYRWSEDNSQEIERGWIARAETVRDLAERLGIEPARLQRTVESYNSYCRNGSDAEFRRRPESLVLLDTPPYYAVTLWPGGPNTQGGPRRNPKSQVMGVDGEPIPGLYAIGELGSVFGMLYTGGGNLAECISSGRIAGEQAAREKPRPAT
ncbi:MAG: FAD-binding protein [Chloroflexi bacterium]|nr:FAD-binding protein [Chloroflexota bacterium]